MPFGDTGLVLGEDPCDVSGAVAEDGHGLLGQGGEDQLAVLAVGHRLPGLWIDNLGQEVVVKHVQGAQVVGGLHGHPGADDLGQTVDVQGGVAPAPCLVDAVAHALGPRLGTQNSYLDP